MRYNFLIFMDFDYLCRRFSILLDCTCTEYETITNMCVIGTTRLDTVYHKYVHSVGTYGEVEGAYEREREAEHDLTHTRITSRHKLYYCFIVVLFIFININLITYYRLSKYKGKDDDDDDYDYGGYANGAHAKASKPSGTSTNANTRNTCIRVASVYPGFERNVLCRLLVFVWCTDSLRIYGLAWNLLDNFKIHNCAM